MKNISLLLLSMFISMTLIAQPTFNSSNFFPVGTSTFYTEVDASSLTPGNAGSNQTYNFGTLVPNGTIDSNQYINSASAPSIGSFPGTNRVVVSGSGSNLSYVYLNVSANSVVVNGIYSNAGGTALTFVYSNPQTQFVFPSTFNTSFNDNFAGQYFMSIGGGITVNNFRSGTINSVADGYGTLITPSGTYSNCLRIKFRQVITDSSVYVGISLPANVTNTISTSYSYMVNVNGIMIDKFTLSYDTTDQQGTFSYSKSANYNSTLTTGISTVTPISTNPIEISQNPATIQVGISLSEIKSGNANLVITDINGRQIKKETLNMQPSEIYNYNVEALKSGLYFMSIKQGEKYWSGRFIKL